MAFLALLHRVMARESLSQAEADEAMTEVLSGHATVAQIAAFVTALKMKGESVEEVAGFASAMRRHAVPVTAGDLGKPLLDTAGTGGSEGPTTFNVSTVAAFVIAGAGVAVAKHGNRSLTSLCGSADVMEALGVNIGLDAGKIAHCIRVAGIGFLFAPALHPAMKHAQPVRAELKTRTVFNLLGPLTNPAGARMQLIGAPNAAAAELMANALSRLDVDRALVVHALDGLDEISIGGPTLAFEVRQGSVTRRMLEPADFGLEPASLATLAGGDKQANAQIAKSILSGETGPRRDIVLMNSAAALWIAGRAGTLAEATELAKQSIDSGRAMATLQVLIRESNN